MNQPNLHNDSLEEILQGVKFEPSIDFKETLQARTKQIAEKKHLTNHRATGFVFARPWKIISAIAGFGLVIVLLFVLVPGAWAQVATFLTGFGVKVPFAPQGLVLSEFKPLAPETVPSDMSYFFSANYDNPIYTELRYFSTSEFIVISESPVTAQDTLPTGSNIQIGSYDAILQENLNGVVMLAAPAQQPWRQVGNGSGGGGGGGGGAMQDAPMVMEYSTGIQLTWYQSDLRIDLLTNLPVEEAVQIAASLSPAQELPQ
jgi:hypothetical protein